MAAGRQECSICMDIFKNPKLIPCHHSFCYKCLEDYVKVNLSNGRFNCPMCRKSVELPPGGVISFKTNVDMDSDSSENLSCDICGPKSVACSRCLECEENLCQACCYVHEKLKTTRNHKVIDLGTLEPEMKGKIRQRIFCDQHLDEEIKLVCKDCKALICVLCKAIKHENHATETVSDAAAEVKKNIQIKMNQCSDKVRRITDSEREADALDKKINDAERKEIKALDDQRLQLIKVIDQEAAKMKDKIQNVYKDLRQQNAALKRGMEEELKKYSTANDNARHLMDHGTDIDIIKKGSDLEQLLSTAMVETDKKPMTRMEKDLFSPVEIKVRELIPFFGMMRDSTEMSLEERQEQHISVKQGDIAKKAIVSAEVLAHMKQQFYRVILMLNAVGDIIHASCSCPAGSGPNCTCKHAAALCYALEDFVKVFVLPEDIPSCTDKLEAWNKPRQVKLPAVPIYDIDFTRKQHGKKRKQKRQLKGEQPEAYKLNKVCDTERAFAESFLCELEQWSKESNPRKQLLINTVASQDDPVETLVSVNPLYDYVEKFKKNITDVSNSNSITKKTELKNCLKVMQDEQLLIQENTLLQSRLSDWFTLRQLRITGSIVSRICNFFLFMKSNPNTISNAILEPSTFSSAAMKYGLDMEPTVINWYVAEKVKEGSNISIKKLGLIVDKDHGFLAVSADGGVEENNSLVGIVECKVAVKWSHQTVVDSAKEPGYPLKSIIINQQGTSVQILGLKPNYAWYRQIQLQLYVCRSFAKYCDLALLHPDSGSFHCQRFELNQEWVDKFLPKLETFFDDYMADKILQKYKLL